MEAFGLLVTLEAGPGKEADAEVFLKSAQPLALNEKGTLALTTLSLTTSNHPLQDQWIY